MRSLPFAARAVGLSLVIFRIAAVASDGAPEPAPRRYEPAREAGRLPADLSECSGIAAGQRNAGVLWAHNDSGHGARLFALRLDGTLLAELRLPGVEPKDWEAIAIGPGPSKGDPPWITVADTGNNDRQRRDLALLRFPEPDLSGQKLGAKLEERSAARLAVRYSSGAHDCEAIAIHPGSGDIFLITKDILTATVFRLAAPSRDLAEATAERLATLPLPLVTDASFDSDGRHVLVRTYVALHEFAVDPNQPFSPKSPAKELIRLRHLERQGEAACYATGGSIITASEGAGTAIHELKRIRS